MTMTTKKTLQAIRRRCSTKVSSDGIFLTARFRGCYDAEDFAQLVRETADSLVFVRKTHKARYTGDQVWLVHFTIDSVSDLYLTGAINLREWQDMN